MWAEIIRPQYDRSGLRCASDLTGEEWALISSQTKGKRCQDILFSSSWTAAATTVLLRRTHRTWIGSGLPSFDTVLRPGHRHLIKLF